MRQRVTARQVAERAGVSRATVSFVLNDVHGSRITPETRERVLQAAEELGYHPDISGRRLATGQTHLIAYVERQPPGEVFSDGFWPEVLHGIHDTALEAGYEVMFAPDATLEGKSRCTRILQGGYADGAIISGPRVDDQELIELLESNAPIVLQGSWPDSDVMAVDVDNIASAKIATEHLIDLGHSQVGLILHAPKVYHATIDRQTGYQQALDERNIPANPDLVAQANFSPASGEAAMAELLALQAPPTAVFATSDTVAIGALRAIRRQGLQVPQDIAVVGFDDISYTEYFDPPLTTIRLPAYELGRASAELLMSILAGQNPEPKRRLLASELIVRSSCGARQAVKSN